MFCPQPHVLDEDSGSKEKFKIGRSISQHFQKAVSAKKGRSFPSISLFTAGNVSLQPGGLAHHCGTQPLHWAANSDVHLHAYRRPAGTPKSTSSSSYAYPCDHIAATDSWALLLCVSTPRTVPGSNRQVNDTSINKTTLQGSYNETGLRRFDLVLSAAGECNLKCQRPHHTCMLHHSIRPYPMVYILCMPRACHGTAAGVNNASVWLA